MKIQTSTFAANLEKLRNYMYYNALGGSAILPIRCVINLFKGSTIFWILFLMFYFNNYSSAMFVYLFLHGSYGIAWVIKDILFPDASFKSKATIGSLIGVSAVLTLYWCIPLSIALRYGIQQITQCRKYFVIILYLSGLFLMLGSDYQKTTTLAKKKGLISTGFFARTRNPNYVGQVMVYGSFAICSGYWTSYGIVFLFDVMSYRHKQGWDQYKKKSYIFLPKLLPTDILNIVFYSSIVLIWFTYYYKQSILT